MIISPIDIRDISKLAHLQPIEWVNILPIFNFYSNSPFCFPIKASVNNEIIGIGSTIIHNDVAWLAHIIVDSNHRCRGIGCQITQTLTQIANKNNCSTIYLIATELGYPVYKKNGFVTETEYLVHKNVEKKDWIISDYIFHYEERFKEQIKVLDKNVSCEDRMIHLEEYFNSSRIYCHNNTVEGYYIPSLGEGLIIANTETAGIELIKLHLKDNDRVVIPKGNDTACAFLEKTGVKEIKEIKRMRLGKERKVQFHNIYNRIGGNVG